MKVKNKFNKIKAYLPEKLSLPDHINKFNPRNYGIDSFDVDHATYLLSQISDVIASDKRQADAFDGIDNYTKLYSVILQSIIQNYRRYLDYFIQTGLIETDNYYITKKYLPTEEEPKSYGYRFTYPYQYCNLVVVDYSERFENILQKRRERYIDSLYLNYGHLTKWLYPKSSKCGLRIDSGKAIEYITTKRDAQLANTDLIDIKRHPRTGRKIQKDPIEQYKTGLININKIETGNLNCYVDQTVFRMHSPLTNLKKELRNYIIYEENGIKHNLYTIDIVNSQPLLATILLDINNIKRINRLGGEVGLKGGDLMLKELCQLYEDEHFILMDDVKLYKSFVSKNGNNPLDLYTYMLNECKIRGIHYVDRDAVKVGMYGVLFGSVEIETKTKLAFAELFPTVYEAFKLVKQNDKRNLSCLLQCIESHFVLTKITKTITKRYPNAPIFTIHDSITTTEEYKDRVYALMEKELEKLVGLVPKLKMEAWLPENVDLEKYQLANFAAS